MRRSIIAVAALLLLLSSTTYATPRRSPRRAPRARFWSVVLCWLGHNHHPRHEYGRLPPDHRGRPHYGPGWHFGWERGQHNGWDRDREHENRGRGPGPGRPREGDRGHGRGDGHGRG